MPSRIYSTFPERKITNPNPPPGPKSGPVGAMPQKQGYCKAGLPGKASNAFAKAKAGIKEVNGYANYKGLSSGKKMNCDRGMEMQEKTAKKKSY